MVRDVTFSKKKSTVFVVTPPPSALARLLHLHECGMWCRQCLEAVVAASGGSGAISVDGLLQVGVGVWMCVCMRILHARMNASPCETSQVASKDPMMFAILCPDHWSESEQMNEMLTVLVLDSHKRRRRGRV